MFVNVSVCASGGEMMMLIYVWCYFYASMAISSEETFRWWISRRFSLWCVWFNGTKWKSETRLIWNAIEFNIFFSSDCNLQTVWNVKTKIITRKIRICSQTIISKPMMATAKMNHRMILTILTTLTMWITRIMETAGQIHRNACVATTTRKFVCWFPARYTFLIPPHPSIFTLITH